MAQDVRRIREHPLVPANVPIRGYIYDVKTGRQRGEGGDQSGHGKNGLTSLGRQCPQIPRRLCSCAVLGDPAAGCAASARQSVCRMMKPASAGLRLGEKIVLDAKHGVDMSVWRVVRETAAPGENR